ncbi:ABC-2 type transport system permease protein [Amycolatopsis marina]|uniref:Transport permease protein n=1 Tax=Amycolatopsis marina TaxID=490629 RepID=A0A1I0VE24_9PSEU|nr:ABC transporter permease [Amycolatopsis marina]SFA74287.1 ABC-2 type transport system permease protein [Amycolatopsis marina]
MTTTTASQGHERSELHWALSDSAVLIGRNVRHVLRSPEQLMLMLFLPIVLLLMFRYVFGGAVDVGSTTYVNYVLPGIIAVSITFNATQTSVGVAGDMLEGIVERFRTMPMLSSAVLVGHVAASVVRTAVSIAVMLGVGFLIGFRPAADVLDWIGAVGLLLLFAIAVSWLAAIVGMLAQTVEGASGMTMPLVFIPYLSSAFVPPDSMPEVLRVFAENQPVTLVIDTVRAMFLGLPVNGTGWIAVLWWAGLIVVAVPLSGMLFRRKVVRMRA